jgi:hypothetical protein
MCNQDEDFAEFARQDREEQAEANRLKMSLNEYRKWKSGKK